MRLRSSPWLLLALALTLPVSSAHAEALTPVLVSITNAACPERPVLEEALARRGLGAVAEGARFRLQLAGAGGALDVTLRDDDGAVLLARTLAAEECGALADAVAMLVERRLDGIAWRAPAIAPPALVADVPAAQPPPTEPPGARAPAARVVRTVRPGRPWAVDVQLGALLATGFAELGAVPGPELGARLRPPGPVGLRLSVGWLVHDGISVSTGDARIDRVPIALSGGYSLRQRRFELDLGLRGEIEILVAETRGIAVPGRDTRAALLAGPAASATLEVVAPVWLSVHAGALGVLSGWEFYVTRRTDPTARTRVASQALALELGASLGFRLGPRSGAR